MSSFDMKSLSCKSFLIDAQHEWIIIHEKDSFHVRAGGLLQGNFPSKRPWCLALIRWKNTDDCVVSIRISSRVVFVPIPCGTDDLLQLWEFRFPTKFSNGLFR